MTMKKNMNRRNFIRENSALAGFFILPSGLLANSPNGKLCTAHIGTGGKGRVDVAQIARHSKTEVVALCDVDKSQMGAKKKKPDPYPDAQRFQDYREMFAKMGDKIDAVSISTPDHTHYPATLAAMELGKHVYTQKPLTNNLAEARHLMELAREKNLVTQMGIQNKASMAYRMATHFIREGKLGKISKVYVWSNKNWGYDGAAYQGEDPVPGNLDWNLWLGTAAKRAFLEGKYHPGQWRRMMDFGCGTLGDMGVHIFDTPYDALGLKPPKWVSAKCRESTGYGLPTKTQVSYGFEETVMTTKDFQWSWCDGDNAPPSGHPDLEKLDGQKLPSQGAMIVGEGGRMLLPHTAAPKFFPKSLQASIEKPDLPKSVNHYYQWIDAIFGSKIVPAANFDYSASMMESVLLGVLAGRLPGKKIEWDSEEMLVTNYPEANRFLKRTLRKF